MIPMDTKETKSSPIIDFHVHIFPEKNVSTWTTSLRKSTRQLFIPFSHTVHRLQPITRHVPAPLREKGDQLGGVVAVASLLFTSTPSDLNKAMKRASVDYALTIAHPPFASNDFILKACAENPKLIPVVNIPKHKTSPSKELTRLVKKGAKVLKIHPAADGDGPTSKHYHTLLRTAGRLGIPVIIHTGAISSKIIYKDPEKGHAELYKPWFEKYKDVRFILAHMNFHFPLKALDLAEEFGNIMVDTSWQPSEIIGEAVRRIGAERVLFGTDWPIFGDNLMVHLDRIKDGIKSGTLTEADARLIRGLNALKLLNMEPKTA